MLKVYWGEFSYIKQRNNIPFFSLIAAPSATVQQLTASVINARNITITWDPPPEDMVNGILRSYVISYFPTLSPNAPPTAEEESLPGNETSFTVDGLRPFTNYTFSVVAVTVGPGPPADVVVETEQAGRNIT